jgi:hypothetical protein
MVQLKGEWKVTTTTKTFARGLSTEQQQVNKIVEEYKDIFVSPTRVHVHCQVNHSIDLTPGAPLHNGNAKSKS